MQLLENLVIDAIIYNANVHLNAKVATVIIIHGSAHNVLMSYLPFAMKHNTLVMIISYSKLITDAMESGAYAILSAFVITVIFKQVLVLKNQNATTPYRSGSEIKTAATKVKYFQITGVMGLLATAIHNARVDNVTCYSSHAISMILLFSATSPHTFIHAKMMATMKARQA